MLNIGIGIPTYNQRDTIIQCIESVISQTYQAKNIYISDDYSTDGTWELISEKYKDVQNIKLSRNSENIGRVANYRALLGKAKHEDFYLNVDGDDILIDKLFLEDCVNAIYRYPGIKIITGLSIKGEESETKTKPIGDNNIVAAEIFIAAMFTKKRQFPHLTTMFRVKDALRLKFYEKNIISSDRTSLLRLLVDAGEVFVFEDKYRGMWRRHSNNTSGAKKINGYIENTFHVIEVLEGNNSQLKLKIKIALIALQGHVIINYIYKFLKHGTMTDTLKLTWKLSANVHLTISAVMIYILYRVFHFK